MRTETPPAWTVTQLNAMVRGVLEEALPPLWVSGEVANWTRARSGHCYFTLKDERSQVRCVMWRTEAARLPMDPEDGMCVRVFGGLTIYEARGEYQLAVRRLEADDADGLWRLAFEKLRRRLEGEGLLAPERKRPVPRFPECVGIVTSPTGAAIRDILTVIRRRAPWTRVVVRGCRVQGEGAGGEVARALRALGGSGRCQVVIVGRGGGSIEDLWAFNEEVVARAIADCPVPVISAVGHEVDVTIADLVADLRAPTPSAAAEAAVPDGEALGVGLRKLPERLARGLRGCVARRERRIVEGRARLERSLRRRIQPLKLRSEGAGQALERAVRAALERRRRSLAAAAGKLEALSPLAVLSRGYAVPLAPGGGVLRRVAQFEPGSPFTLLVSDGRVSCRAVEAEEAEGAPGVGVPGDGAGGEL